MKKCLEFDVAVIFLNFIERNFYILCLNDTSIAAGTGSSVLFCMENG